MLVLTFLFLEGGFGEGQCSIFLTEFQEYLVGVHRYKGVESL
jgi:hypothetical protein